MHMKKFFKNSMSYTIKMMIRKIKLLQFLLRPIIKVRPNYLIPFLEINFYKKQFDDIAIQTQVLHPITKIYIESFMNGFLSFPFFIKIHLIQFFVSAKMNVQNECEYFAGSSWNDVICNRLKKIKELK